jgi:hypothetical protein
MEPLRTTAAQPAAPSASPAPPEADRAPKRRVRNYLLDTPLQLKLASYLLAVATALSLGLGWLLWQAYRETSRVVALGAPDVGDSIAQALAVEDRWRIVLVAVALAGVLLCLLGAAVVITHRIAGPAFVIARTCRQVGEGHLERPRSLRSRDLLVDLADDVAVMVDALRDREAREEEIVLRGATALRELGGGSAASELERLASEKAARLRS